jgi:hypothetical protein
MKRKKYSARGFIKREIMNMKIINIFLSLKRFFHFTGCERTSWDSVVGRDKVQSFDSVVEWLDFS